MKLPHRRRFLHLAASAIALPAVSRFAWAQSYPTRPAFAPLRDKVTSSAWSIDPCWSPQAKDQVCIEK
jgi:hypothetical protein